MTSVCVIVPCYNAAKTLRLCLEAVLAQTRRPDEIVVVDDAGSDGSAGIAASLGCRVVRLPENRGVSAARNAGAAATTADVLFFLDSDVALRPDALANALAVLDADPGCGCVQGVYETEPLIDDGPAEWYRVLHAAFWRRRHLGEVTGLVFALAAVRRDVFQAAGGFDEALRDCEDVEYASRLHGRCRVVLTDAVQGRHDDGSRLAGILAEQWRRAVPLVPLLLAAARRGGGQPEHANRPAGILAVALAPVPLPLAVLHPAFLALSAACVLAFAVSDPPLVRFVHRHRGTAFTAYFLLVHLAVHAVLVSGMAFGALRLLRRPARAG
ncbi:glycosyltransferase [Spirillospora sp. NPDC049024]